MAASQIMEMTSSEDEDQDLIELEAIRRPYRAVKFDLTHSNQEAQHYHEPKHTDALNRNSWSSSTQKVLSSMPSRSIRFNQSTALSRSTKTIYIALYCVLCGGCYCRVSQQKSIQLWQGVLKNISAHFGTGILSYFIFLRRLLHYNIILFLITGLFLVLPQISNPPSSKNKPAATADLWMLTGMGILTDSVMFYGHYANSTNEKCKAEIKLCPENYNMPLAYIFTIGAGMFITCVLLVYSISKSSGKSFCIFKTTSNLALKVFCSWDFKVSKKRSVKLQSVNICIQLKKAVDLLKLPLVMSCISHLLPGFFDMLSRVEHYDSTSTPIYVSIVRNLLLKGCIFSVLCYYWLEKISGGKNGQNTQQCWETLIGQELYRLVLMDLLFAMSYIVLAEFLWGLCIRNITFRRRKLEFDIARDVLELIYGQTLVWFGVLFSPLLPAVQIGKLFLLFYFKKTSLMMNFQPPRKHWRATQMSTFFIKLLFLPSFTGALACVIYTMWRVKPSSDCGPFSNLRSMLLLGKTWIRDLGKSNPSMLWLSWAYNNLVDNPLFLFITAGLFL
ncbi:transmembrane channel-like protein 6 [Sinocyclocheilus grahami]|uniref:transmembrane channel-like protein 6 n=1 Tax=Sinocyclocheilus grahami TaxID=75366 RepID=UPI0007AD034B|nr:PREDICTED: transmembrane channel-like protein 6 [Sinocyclocheilus grahami]